MIQTELAFIEPRDPRVSDVEAPRLSRQSQQILALLRQGQKTNGDLARVTARFGARIFDLRAAGHRIEIVSRDRKTGVVVYALKQGDQP